MAEIAIRSHLEDDEDMGDMPGTSKVRKNKNKKNSVFKF